MNEETRDKRMVKSNVELAKQPFLKTKRISKRKRIFSSKSKENQLDYANTMKQIKRENIKPTKFTVGNDSSLENLRIQNVMSIKQEEKSRINRKYWMSKDITQQWMKDSKVAKKLKFF